MARLTTHLRAFGAQGQAVALAAGAIGGAVFALLHFPLAWMLGAMVGNGVAGALGSKARVSNSLRNLMMIVLGVLLGSSFRPDLFDAVGTWAWSIGGLVVYLVVSVGIGTAYLRWWAGPDPVTAYFSAAPGGMTEMVMMGEQLGGQPHFIALSHSVRILMVVFSVPLGFALFTTLDAVPMPLAKASTAGALDYAMLAGGALGAFVARFLKVPAPWLVGPMVCSGALHIAGLTTAVPPVLVVCAAQVVVGSSIGVQFRNFDLGALRRAGVAAGTLTLILLAFTLAFAWLVHLLSGLPVSDLILAYSPGGFTEMSLIGLALGADTAFVSAHHMLRISMIAAFAPAIFKLFKWT